MVESVELVESVEMVEWKGTGGCESGLRSWIIPEVILRKIKEAGSLLNLLRDATKDPFILSFIIILLFKYKKVYEKCDVLLSDDSVTGSQSGTDRSFKLRTH
jgi:hypothetical protein